MKLLANCFTSAERITPCGELHRYKCPSPFFNLYMLSPEQHSFCAVTALTFLRYSFLPFFFENLPSNSFLRLGGKETKVCF